MSREVVMWWACAVSVVFVPRRAMAQEGASDEVTIDEGRAGEREVDAEGVERARVAVEPRAIREVVASRREAFRACFEEGAVKGEGRLPGKVSIRFVIGTDGAVESATVKGEGVKGAAECLEKELEALVFPAPRGGGKVVVTYPWNIGTQ